MTPTHCPKCQEELGRIEQLDGKCLSCGERFEKSTSIRTIEPEENSFNSARSVREPMNGRQKASIALLIVFLLSIATPWGMIYSCYLGVQKGAGLCAGSGCVNESTKKIEYTGGVKIGYCDEHAKDPEKEYSSKQGKFPYAMSLLALFFVGFYIGVFKESYTGKVSPPTDPKKPPADPFRNLVKWTLIGVFAVNGAVWFCARYVA
jgi:hypothetical protein